MSKRESEETHPRLKRKVYEKELHKLQTELCRSQDRVAQAGYAWSSLSKGAVRAVRAG
jgi:hypothetical protein